MISIKYVTVKIYDVTSDVTSDENTQVTVKVCTVFYLQHQKDYYKKVPPAQNQRNVHHRHHLEMSTAMKTEKVKA